MIKSIFKWAGGKRRQLGMILPLLPGKPDARIVEPFCGSAVVGVNHPSHTKWLNDTDRDIIATYSVVMREPEELIEECRVAWDLYGNNEEGYKRARSLFNDTRTQTYSRVKRSALAIYLNRFSFNGLWRKNLKGEFNAPFGRYINVSVPWESIMAYHTALACANTVLTSHDFEMVIDGCGENDVIYADPPFAPKSKTASFTGYGVWMGEVDLNRLDLALYRATQRGALAVASASDTDMSHRAHLHADVVFKVEAHRSISCKPDGRVPTGELLFVYKGGE